MITRIWHGRTNPQNSEGYLQFLLTKGTDEYLETSGNLSVKVWERKKPEYTDFWTVTEWNDPEAIKLFAGNDYEKAKYYPEDEGILLEFEENVDHYQCHDVSNTKVREYQRQLLQLYYGGSWQAESYVKKLKNVTDEDAFRVPLAGVHCIAEVVWHVIYWRMSCIQWIEGNKTYKEETVAALNFLSISELQQKGWEKLKSELAQTQATLIERLNPKRDEFLKEEYLPNYTFDYLLEGQVHHDVYHLGQIGLLMKIISLTPGK